MSCTEFDMSKISLFLHMIRISTSALTFHLQKWLKSYMAFRLELDYAFYELKDVGGLINGIPTTLALHSNYTLTFIYHTSPCK